MLPTRAKIVCTLGPSSSSPETIAALIEAGMDVARLNFSHGTHEEHRALVKRVREASEAADKPVGIIVDLQGPKIRVGRIENGQVELRRGARVIITSREILGTAERVSTTYGNLVRDVAPGDSILLDDGMISLRVVSCAGEEVECEVVVGGILKDNKGINIPGAALSIEAITEKDLRDADFAIAERVDFLAMSFVRHPDDLAGMRTYLKGKNADIPLVAKIEKPQAIDHIDEIIRVSDAVMVARGDLGVEMLPEQVPVIQKQIIAKCNQEGVPVITATQMLDSMVSNPRPTRAEASDVANAILDGSDALMLSAESAVGKYPVQAVEVMKRIIHTAEAFQRPPIITRARRSEFGPTPVNEGIAVSARFLAEQVDARAIVSVTLSGSMAREISKNRPTKPIYAISQHLHVLRQLSLNWGIEGIMMGDLTMTSIDDALLEVERFLKGLGKLAAGDRLVLTAGVPFSRRQATNMVRVDEVK